MRKVLVADDDPAIVESITLILEEYGYLVQSTSDGQTLYQLKYDLPDLILLDIWMSGDDGREICTFLKKQENTKHIPIIMISASRDIKKSARDAGADDFLAKPFNIDELIKIIEKCIR